LEDIWGGFQAATYCRDADAADLGLRIALARLDLIEARLASAGRPFVGGDRPSHNDALLFSLLLRLDLAQRAALGWGAPTVAYWPQLWDLVRRVLALAALDQAELAEAGLIPGPDGTYNEPYGPLPPNYVLADPRAAWLEPPREPRRRLAPLDDSVPPTPWSGDLPPATRPLPDLKAALDAAAAPADDAGAEVTQLVRWVDDDLVDGIGQLAAGADALTQQALRRVFFARLSGLEARLRSHPYLAGDRPTAADRRLARFCDFYGAGELPGLTPIDPVLADFPDLTAFYQRG
jgi:glutathione S-transferase